METLPPDEFTELALRSDIPSLTLWYNTNTYYRAILSDSRVLASLSKQHQTDRVSSFPEFIRTYYVAHPNLEALDFLPLQEYATLLSREFKTEELLALLVEANRTSELDELLSKFFIESDVLEDAILVSLAREQYELAYVLLSYLPEYTSFDVNERFAYPDQILRAMRDAPPDLWKLILDHDTSRRAQFYVVSAAVRLEDEEFVRDIIPHIGFYYLDLIVDWAVKNNNGRLLSYIHKNMRSRPDILAGYILGAAIEQENLVWMKKAVQLRALNIPNIFQRLLYEGNEELAMKLWDLTKMYRDPESSSYIPEYGEDLELLMQSIHQGWVAVWEIE